MSYFAQQSAKQPGLPVQVEYQGLNRTIIGLKARTQDSMDQGGRGLKELSLVYV